MSRPITHKDRLTARYRNNTCKEGDYVEIDGKNERIKHITLNGFLYNKSMGKENNYVTVTKGRKTNTYYANWDYLSFIPCDVYLEPKS